MSTQKPTLIAYVVKERGKGKKAIWTKIGAAWPHGNGKGLSLELQALPLDGRVVSMEPQQESAQGDPAGEEA